ncbi:MAG: hypothetical protein Q9195_008934 [Heterodermia aff. obscurata]
MILWGTVTCCMAAVKSYKQLVALRVVVGILEAGFAPGVLLILSSWYKPEEQSKRFAVYISAAILSGAFGGLLAGAITKNLDAKPSILVQAGSKTNQNSQAIIAHFLLLDFPLTSQHLTQAERRLAHDRLQTGTPSTENIDKSPAAPPLKTAFRAIRLSLTNPTIWLFTAGYMVIVGSSTLSYFYPTLVQGLGYTATKAQYMTVPIYAVAFVCNALTGYFSDRVPRMRGFIISGWLTLSLACSIATALTTPFTTRYVLLVFLTAGLWSTNALSLSFASSTFGAQETSVRAVSLAFVNAMGNLAQIYGAYLFPEEDKPRYAKGFGVVSGMCALGVGVYAVLGWGGRRRGVLGYGGR